MNTPPTRRPPRAQVYTLLFTLCLWVGSFFAGSLVTGLVSLTRDDWRAWVGARLMIVLVSAALVGLTIAWVTSRRAFLPTTAICATIGLTFSIFPVIDFLRGPVEVTGTLTELRTQWMTYRGQSHLDIDATVTGDDARLVSISPNPNQHLDKRWAACWKRGARVHLVALPAINAVLEASCIAPTAR